MEAVKIFNKKLNDYLYIISNKDQFLITNRQGVEKKFKISLLQEAIQEG